MDIRTVRTRAALKESLLSCLKEKSVEEIQVKEICKRAGVDRTTFYQHYKSINELVDVLIQEQTERFRAMLCEKKESGRELLLDILDSVEQARELYRLSDGGIIAERFKTGIVETAKANGVQGWKEMLPNLEEREAELSYEALLTGALQVALSESERYDRETVANTIMDMVNALIKAFG